MIVFERLLFERDTYCCTIGMRNDPRYHSRAVFPLQNDHPHFATGMEWFVGKYPQGKARFRLIEDLGFKPCVIVIQGGRAGARYGDKPWLAPSTSLTEPHLGPFRFEILLAEARRLSTTYDENPDATAANSEFASYTDDRDCAFASVRESNSMRFKRERWAEAKPQRNQTRLGRPTGRCHRSPSAPNRPLLDLQTVSSTESFSRAHRALRAAPEYEAATRQSVNAIITTDHVVSFFSAVAVLPRASTRFALPHQSIRPHPQRNC